jgi:hypothetical protein
MQSENQRRVNPTHKALHEIFITRQIIEKWYTNQDAQIIVGVGEDMVGKTMHDTPFTIVQHRQIEIIHSEVIFQVEEVVCSTG